MRAIELSDVQYESLESKAVEAGFDTVEEMIHSWVDQALEETPNLDHLFTPEKIAHIRAADREIDEGDFYTLDEVKAHIEKVGAEWQRQNSSGDS
jgi:hypothetical protein